MCANLCVCVSVCDKQTQNIHVKLQEPISAQARQPPKIGGICSASLLALLQLVLSHMAKFLPPLQHLGLEALFTLLLSVTSMK